MLYHRELLDGERLCLLYSGGLNSFIAYHYAKAIGLWSRITCLYVQMGQLYAQKELNCIKFSEDCGIEIQVMNLPITNNKAYMYPIPNIANQNVPGRNFTLSTLAANFGETIWVNTLLGESVPHVPDKNHVFFTLTSAALSHVYGKDYTVESPFFFKTKRGVVALGLSLGIQPSMLKKTISCYHSISNHCGQCEACFNRAVAMRLNGIWEDYDEEPFNSDYAKQIKRRMVLREIVPQLVKDYEEAFALLE